MQIIIKGTKINNLLKCLGTEPDDETHAIVAEDPSDSDEKLIITLSLKGVMSYFPVQKPSTEYYEYEYIPHIIIPGKEPVWEPSEDSFEFQEEAMTDLRGLVVYQEEMTRGQRITNSVSTTSKYLNVIDFKDDDNFYEALVSTVKVSRKVSRVGVSRVVFSKGKKGIIHQTLSKNWMVSPETALRTVNRTTQRGIREVLHPSLSRCWITNDRQLRYLRLRHHVYTDTLKSGNNYCRDNVYAQAYTTSFHWCRAMPMKKKSKAQKTLSLLFQRYGVPLSMIMDGSKDQTLGKFKNKCQEDSCHIRQTEPHSPYQNAVESSIRELKKGAGRKMVRAGAPKNIWDDALEYEAYVRSNTTHCIRILQGEVPHTVM